MATLAERFDAGCKYVPCLVPGLHPRCIEHCRTFSINGKMLSSINVSYFIHFGRWEKRVYRKCGNPKCVSPNHLTLKRPPARKLVCWGQTFRSVRELWQHPRCYVRTVSQLSKRLQKYAPEDAVVPSSFKYKGKRYTSIHAIPLPEGMSRSTLYARLGCIYVAKKFTVDLALDSQWWEDIEPCLPKVGNIYGASSRSKVGHRGADLTDPTLYHKNSKGMTFRNPR